MASKTSTSVEDRIRRIGVSWRKNPTGNPTKCVVEMRPPNWKWKLFFGSYDTEVEAMIARDYGAFLRVSAGEDDTSAGGFYADDHPSVYEFEESLYVFESLEDSKVRCDEYKRLHPLYYQQPKEKWSGDGNPPHKEFCREARNDIAIAIGKFRGRYPHKFVNSRPTEAAKDLSKDGPPDGGLHFTPPSSNFEVKVSQSSNWMPEYSLQKGRTSQLEQFTRGYNFDVKFQGQSPERSRVKEGSKHFGVKFRPDLQKWVAEVGVVEWKTVDKRIWLGTFDCEEGAARAVDAARKLLKCKKNRPANFPCEALNAYAEKIPPNLNLNNLRDDSMFKEVTLFVKRKAQEYAASFISPNITSCIPISSDQVQLAKYISLESRHEGFGMQDDGVSMAGFSTSSSRSSYGSYSTQLASFKGVITRDCGQWMSPTSITYSSTPGCLSGGTSVEDETGLYSDNCYNHPQGMIQIDERSVDGGGVHRQLASSGHVENKGKDHETNPGWAGENMGNKVEYPLPDNDQWLTEVNDLLFPIDDECFEDQTAMDIDKMVYVDSLIQSSTTSLHETEVAPDFNRAPSHRPATTPNSISALNKKVMSKAEMVEKRFKSNTPLAKGCHALSEHKEALLAARLDSERAKLDMAVQKSNKVKIANLRTARNDGVISNEEFKQQVKEILDL